MALRTTYEQFLAAPNPLSLTDNATFHYIPTLTSFSQPGPIVKHLDSQARTVVNKKKEKTLSAVEGESAVALEVETTLEFISGGGAYLPKLENFVVDRIATFPTVREQLSCIEAAELTDFCRLTLSNSKATESRRSESPGTKALYSNRWTL